MIAAAEPPTLDLSMVPSALREHALDAYDAGNAMGILITMSNAGGLAFVCDNSRALRAKGIYEEALVYAYTGVRTNWSSWSLETIHMMFILADRAKLLAAGSPLPPGEQFTLYRGVAGVGRARRCSGMSWTNDRDRARWFATRLSHLPGPAVHETIVSASEIYCYYTGRDENDFIVRAQRTRIVDRCAQKSPCST